MTMLEDEFILVDIPLVPDPDADEELGPAEAEAITDEELRDCRLLIVRRAVEAIDLAGDPGGAIQLNCSFQPGPQTRFTWARLVLHLTSPEGLRLVDLQPREVRESEPVQFTLGEKGQIGVKYSPLEATAEETRSTQYAQYYCVVHGSGEGTGTARWDFEENPQRRDGIGREQTLALTLPGSGLVEGILKVNARIKRPGLRGRAEAIRDMVIGTPNWEHPIEFDIPLQRPKAGLSRFLRL
jgi:hypothetical protein